MEILKKMTIIKYLVFLVLQGFAYYANAQSCPDGNHPHAIDLGLPSGTKWACCNVGATTPEGYGSYYAWGETKENKIYDWTTYIHCDGSMETCHDIGSDIAGTDYDVAHVRWGGSWVMPSKDQIEELTEKCSYTGTTKNGVEGGLFIGPSGGTIFLPAADICWDGFIECLVPGGYYWSSTLSLYTDDAYRLYLDISWGGSCGGEARAHGLTVRPVISGTNNIVYSKSSIDGTHQAIYSINGIKAAETISSINDRPHGIYVKDGRKFVVK